MICASEDVEWRTRTRWSSQPPPRRPWNSSAAEAQLNLAHAVVYIATAPKSNRVTTAIGAALGDVREGRTLAVPEHLRDAHYKGAKKLGHGSGYKYSHDYEGGYVPQAYLTEGRRYYEPTENGLEKRVKERLDYWRAQFDAAQGK